MGDSTTEGQEKERQRLKMKKETLDAQLQDGRVLSVEVRERQKCTLVCHLGFAPKFPLTFTQEEESLVPLEEDCEALDAALEFENICIQERQKRINTNSSSNQSPNTEPDQLIAVIRKIRTLSATEASELLIKYFNKVRCSLWTHVKIPPVAQPHTGYSCVFAFILCRETGLATSLCSPVFTPLGCLSS